MPRRRPREIAVAPGAIFRGSLLTGGERGGLQLIPTARVGRTIPLPLTLAVGGFSTARPGRRSKAPARLWDQHPQR